MHSHPIRFRPPNLEISPEIRWVLLRAFGPPGAPFQTSIGLPVEPRELLSAARRFEVSARIASRQGQVRLAGELGVEIGGAFQRDRLGATALGMRLLSLAREVAEAAEPLQIPLVFLKFVALDGAGLPVVGGRGAADVDVLVPPGRSRDLQNALLARGFRSSGHPGSEHQLPGLEHPGGGVVEVHRLMLGVRLDGRASATAESLERHGLLTGLTDLPGCCSIPVREALAAHVLVHGVGQHGYWPASYSLLKMVGDLIDLGCAGPATRPGLARQAYGWVARDLSAGEADAVFRLCDSLSAGWDPVDWDPQAGESVLLRHILAGRLDPGYAASLRLGLFRPQPTDHSLPGKLARSVLGALFLTRGQIDTIYGPPRHPLGYTLRRLARPFDLLVRLATYLRR
jgi:hypothetical protein